jgi:hypothetical protein
VRLAVEKAAAPEPTGTVASTVLPSRNWTVPVAAEFRVAVNVTAWPVVDGFKLEANDNAALIFTLCDRAPDVEPALLASPLYEAMMECVPCASEEPAKVTEPFERVPAPNTEGPSRNCTVPVAVAGVTEAVKVTDAPSWEGFCDDTTITEVATWTVWVIAAELADVSLASPPYAAAIECVPEVNDEVEKDATPETTEAEPIREPLSVNWAVPVAVDGVTVAVNVTLCPAVEGLGLEVTTTEDAAFTARLIAGEVAGGRLMLPGYWAVNE